MLRFLLLFLLCLNVIAFLSRNSGKEVFEPLPPPLAEDYIMLVRGDDRPPSGTPQEAQAANNTVPIPDTLACIEWGPVSESFNNNAKTALSNLGMHTYRETLRVIQITSWWVNIDGFASRQSADNAASSLKAKGITDISVLEVQGSFVLSLGIFSAKEGAQTRLNELGRINIDNAQITPRGTSAVFFEINDVTQELIESLTETASRFPNSRVQTVECRDNNEAP